LISDSVTYDCGTAGSNLPALVVWVFTGRAHSLVEVAVSVLVVVANPAIGLKYLVITLERKPLDVSALGLAFEAIRIPPSAWRF
jgi:hypothetical protein